MKILWLCKNKQEVDLYEEAASIKDLNESRFVDPFSEKRGRDEYCLIFALKGSVDFVFTDVSARDFQSKIAHYADQYDAVGLPLYFDRLHISGTVGDNIRALSEELTTRGKSIFLFLCDVKFPLVGKYIKKNTLYGTDPSANKYLYPELFAEKQPLELIFAGSQDFPVDLLIKSFIPAYWREKQNGTWRLQNRKAPYINFHYIEWLSLAWPLMKKEYELWKADYGEVANMDIRKFYYGINRLGIVSSLKAMDFGSSPQDYLFGKVHKHFPEIKDLCDYSKDNKFMPGEWRKYMKTAEEVLFPFEKIKTEYQLSLRVMEYVLYSGLLDGEPPNIVSDPRVSTFIQHIFQDKSGALLDASYETAVNKTRSFFTSLIK